MAKEGNSARKKKLRGVRGGQRQWTNKEDRK